MRDLDPRANPMKFFGSEVRHARLAAGMKQAELGKITGYATSEVSRFESGIREATQEFASGCDTAFPAMNGWFSRFLADAPSWAGPFPPWFRPWVDKEGVATVIRWWEPLLVPGLVQTEAYMRAVFESWKPDDSDAVDRNIRARLDRQAILDREVPSELWFLLDASVLRRQVGTPGTMRAQMTHLAALSECPNITIQIVPGGACAYAGLSGAFAIAEVEGGRVAYLESSVQGMVFTEPALLHKAASMFGRLQAEALPLSQTRELLEKAGETWKS